MTITKDIYPELYDTYAGAIYGYISRSVTDEETVNTVFEKSFVSIFRDIALYSSLHSTLFTWMMGIVQQEITAAKNDKPGLVLQS